MICTNEEKKMKIIHQVQHNCIYFALTYTGGQKKGNIFSFNIFFLQYLYVLSLMTIYTGKYQQQ